MKKFVMMLVVNGITLWIMDMFLSGIYFPSTKILLSVALALGILNATLRPVLKAIAFPVTLVTLGLFSLVINGVVLNLALSLGGAEKLSLGSAVIASVVFAVVNSFVGKVISD